MIDWSRFKFLTVGLFLLVAAIAISFFTFRNQIAGFFLDKAQERIYGRELESAGKYLNMVRIINKNNARLYYTQGNIALLEGKKEEALSYFIKALDLGYEPKDWVVLKIADIHWGNGDYEKAAAGNEELRRLKPDNHLYDYRLGFLYAEMKRWTEAIDVLARKVEAVNPETHSQLKADFYNQLGRAYNAVGSHNEAVNAYIKSLELNPHQLLTLARYGRLLQRLGDVDGATAEINKALAIDPNYKPALCALSEIYIRKGENENAIGTAQKALANQEIWVDNLACFYHSARANYNQGNSSAAKLDLEKLLDNFQKLNLEGSEYQGLKTAAQDLLARIE